MSTPARDHIFVSYATEDLSFAEWLTLKLTMEGYAVWCDKVKLLGGESYPSDIAAAIKDRTFRFLAVMSRSSAEKPNPRKERTLAANVARERREDFIIPLNLDGLRSTELDLFTQDLTYIPFSESWAAGLHQLLKKLASVSAPRIRSDGKGAVSQWLDSKECLSTTSERLWTNTVEIIAHPNDVLRVSGRPDLVSRLKEWPTYRESDAAVWALELPEDVRSDPAIRVETLDVRTRRDDRDGPRPRHVLKFLLNEYLRRALDAGGLARRDDDKRYFPVGLLPNNQLSFTDHRGKKRHVQPIGERTFSSVAGRTKVRYHLAPVLDVQLSGFDRPLVRLRLHVHLTHLDGTPLAGLQQGSRRRRICKMWWNREWFLRYLAVWRWMFDGTDQLNLALTDQMQFVLSARPRTFDVPFGIDESRLKPIEEEDENAEIDEALADTDDEAPNSREEDGHAV